MSNIAEGFERDGDKEFRQFLFLAKASCGEVCCQLYLARRLDYLTPEAFERLHQRSLTITRMIASLIRGLTESGYRGKKYR